MSESHSEDNLERLREVAEYLVEELRGERKPGLFPPEGAGGA